MDFLAARKALLHRPKGAHWPIVLAGLASEWCVQFTAMDAYLRGYSVWVPQDCIASASEEDHAAAVRYLRDGSVIYTSRAKSEGEISVGCAVYGSGDVLP